METITIKTTGWNVEAMTGYKPITTFWTDFSIAEKWYLIIRFGSGMK